MATVPFDRVIVSSAGRSHELTLAEFMALPLPQRIRHILARDVSFYEGDRPIERGEALRRLNAWQAQTG